MKRLLIFVTTLMCSGAIAQIAPERENNDQFRDLVELPTPNGYRSATGYPGEKYYQQRADHKMNIILSQDKNMVYGTETITYYNNSEDELNFLWLTLDQNYRLKESYTKKISNQQLSERKSVSANYLTFINDEFDGGHVIEYVKDSKGNDLKTYLDHTIMRVDLDKPIAPGGKFVFSIKWSFDTNYNAKDDGRTGLEKFKDGSYIYTIAQFFPRMCVYNDEGWQTEQYIFNSEFALEFGNYDVTITAPDNHIIAATGVLQNAKQVLSPIEFTRYKSAFKASEPQFIVTPEEAAKREKSKANGTKTWRFKAENVRDFAFASSPKFIWDAMKVTTGKTSTVAMSFYPNEANPLWEQYGTRSIAYTLEVYSDYLFDYPYPAAIAVHTDGVAMEYPMLSFNRGRPNDDGVYSKRIKQMMIGGTVIHEVGHNYFPMIVNTDERRHCWFDESLNTFMEGIAVRAFDKSDPNWWAGNPQKITAHMSGDPEKISPIMTRPDALRDYSYAIYRRPVVALTILRETILGREAFDKAFKEFANAWKFKHPTPADFFRMMESVSGQKLNWFFRGWYFTTLPVDISIDNVTECIPVWNEELAQIAKDVEYNKPMNQQSIRIDWAEGTKSAVDSDKSLVDSYTFKDNSKLSQSELKKVADVRSSLSKAQLDMLQSGTRYYELRISNNDGMIMPLVLLFEFTDGTTEEVRLPAEVWMVNQKSISKIFRFNKELKSVTQDPYDETSDINIDNNRYPRSIKTKYIEVSN